jgi:hypothetical protein
MNPCLTTEWSEEEEEEEEFLESKPSPGQLESKLTPGQQHELSMSTNVLSEEDGVEEERQEVTLESFCRSRSEDEEEIRQVEQGNKQPTEHKRKRQAEEEEANRRNDREKQQRLCQQVLREKVRKDEEKRRQVEQGNKQPTEQQRKRKAEVVALPLGTAMRSRTWPKLTSRWIDKEEHQRQQEQRMKEAQAEERRLLEKQREAEQFEEQKREAEEEQKRRLVVQEKAKQEAAVHEEAQKKEDQRKRQAEEVIKLRKDKEEQQRKQQERMKEARGRLEKQRKAEEEKKRAETTSRQRFAERKRAAEEEQKRRLAAQEKAKQAAAAQEEAQKRWQHSNQKQNHCYTAFVAHQSPAQHYQATGTPAASVAPQPPVQHYQATGNRASVTPSPVQHYQATGNPAADSYMRQRETERMRQQQWHQANGEAHRAATSPQTQCGQGQPYSTATINGQPQWQQQQQGKHSEQQKSQTPYSTQAHPTSPQQQAHPANVVVANAGQDSIATIKKSLMTSWALQPPMFQTLRAVDELVSTIHLAFPPAFGVAHHAYFSKWKPITRESLMQSGVPDKEKLNRAMRKMRFFLHPDKLPKDLDEKQTFLCKTLWDVASDGWEHFNISKQ